MVVGWPKLLSYRYIMYSNFYRERKTTKNGKNAKEKIGVASILPAHILNAATHIIYDPNYIT